MEKPRALSKVLSALLFIRKKGSCGFASACLRNTRLQIFRLAFDDEGEEGVCFLQNPGFPGSSGAAERLREEEHAGIS